MQNQRMQASLGSVEYPSRGDLDNAGKIALARVFKVNNRDQTVDVYLQNGTYIGQHDGEEEQSVTCIRLQEHAGFNEDKNYSWGRARPLRKGDFVLVAFIDSDKHKPIILGAVPPIDYTTTPAPEVEAIDDSEFEHEKDESFDVSPRLDYTYDDGLGQKEKVSHTGAFAVAKGEKVSDHRENQFTFEDLTLKDKWTYKTIRREEEDLNYTPFNYLFVSKNQFNDTDSTIYHRLYHDAETGVTRFSKDSFNSLFYIENDADGFTIQYQPNSSRRKPKEYEPVRYPHTSLRKSDHEFLYPREPREMPEFQPVDDFTKVHIDTQGNLVIKVQKGEEVSEISIGENGVSLKSTEEINIHSDKSINFSAPTIGSTPMHPISYSKIPNMREEDTDGEWEHEWIEPPETYGDRVQGQ